MILWTSQINLTIDLISSAWLVAVVPNTIIIKLVRFGFDFDFDFFRVFQGVKPVSIIYQLILRINIHDSLSFAYDHVYSIFVLLNIYPFNETKENILTYKKPLIFFKYIFFILKEIIYRNNRCVNRRVGSINR